MTTLLKTLSRLKSKGLNFDFALDIGAHHGEWFKKFHSVFPGTRVISIEANSQNIPVLKQANPNLLNLCLGEKFSRRPLFLPDPSLTKDNTGASLYKERLSFYDNAEKIDVEVVPLDSLNLAPDLIKLDIQGAELEVLRGGLSTLASCQVLQIELAMVEYNQGAPSPSELISFLYEHGYILDSFFDLIGTSERLIYCDGLFLRKDLLHLRSDISFIQR